MITLYQIEAIWKQSNINASKAEVTRILEAFDRLNTLTRKDPLEVAPGQKVFVSNTDNGDDEVFVSLKEAQEFLQSRCEDRDWEPEYVDDYVTVIVGREVSIELSKVFSVKFS
jgi:hypothetical protein